jgi:GNAT superfamily N-acetyltransferase
MFAVVHQFQKIHLPEMTQLYIRLYDPKEIDWDIQTTTNFLEQIVTNNSPYCFEALIDGACVGAIFVTKGLPCKNVYLAIEPIQVLETHQGEGIGTQLLTALLDKAKTDGIFGIHFLIDKGKEPLISWYAKHGAVPTQALEYAIYLK